MNSSIDVFRKEMGEFQAKSQAVIDALVSVATGHEDDMASFFDEQCDELKSYLGAQAANNEADASDQESVMAEAESWVSTNVCGNLRDEIAGVLFLQGLEAGAALVLDAAEAIAS